MWIYAGDPANVLQRPFWTALANVDRDGEPDAAWIRCACTPQALDIEIGGALNQSIHRLACGGGAAAPLGFHLGTPYAGNLGFAVSLSGALPGVGAALGLSLGEATLSSGGCVIGLDLSPGQLILPFGSWGVVVANTQGGASVALPLPNDPRLAGAAFFAQWIALDPASPFLINCIGYALSDVRKVVIW